MRIAYDLRRIANVGIGRYMKTLVETVVRLAPQNQFVLIMAQDTAHLTEVPPQVTQVIAKSRYYSVAEQLELPAILRKQNIDLLHAPHFVIPLRKTCPTVATIHDAIHFVYPQDISSTIGRVYARIMMNCAVRQADRIITVSEFSRQDIVRYTGAEPDKITVIHPVLSDAVRRIESPVLIRAMRAKYGITRDYILYTGIFRERKNHGRLLQAFARLVDSGYDLDLVFSGPMEEGKKSLAELAVKLRIEDRLIFAGFVPDNEISAVYSGATIYACPSLYEGFGFTPLEAMACGVPVVCHEGTSLPEVCGDAALYSDARDPEHFAQALQKVLDDSELRSSLIRLGFRNVRRFSSDAFGKANLRLYSELHDNFLCSASDCVET